ncbi:MAG: hypothetical protein LPK45_00460, partial [Bacteroidota bacterium]|nr:hypothetical protein [Bacteroidota bacterium]MDX5429498.1 hypothetical protein [Bacteroidota bacterium]MDX5468283.1 hypothetical protein [Bacteroidota bacterium]
HLLVQWQNRKGALVIAWKSFAWIFKLAVFGLSFSIVFLVFPTDWAWPLLVAMVGSFFLFRGVIERASFRMAVTVIVCFGVMNAYFYPSLLKYQQAQHVSELYNTRKTENSRFYIYKTGVSHSLDFYQDKWVPGFSYEAADSVLHSDHIYVYTNKSGLKAYQENGIQYEVIDSMDYFRVTQLNWKFLNPKTRQEVIRKRYFLELKN